MKRIKDQHIGEFLLPKYLIFILIFITLVFYGRSLFFDFLSFDDETFITLNPVIANLDLPWTDCLKYKFQAPDYFPLSFFTWRLLNLLFGFNPFVFHLVNVVVHTLNVLLVFYVSREILGQFYSKSSQVKYYAFFIALAFSIHPLHVESVAWIIDLKDLLSSFFFLGGMLFYMYWLKNRKLSCYLFTVLAALISLLYKSTGITFFAVLFLIDYFQMQRLTLKSLLPKIPFVFIVLFGLYIFGFLTKSETIQTGFNAAGSSGFKAYFPEVLNGSARWVEIVITASFRVFFWIKQTIIPWSQTVFYSRNQLLNQYTVVLLYLPVAFLALVFFSFLFKNRVPLVWAGLLFFLITISPSLVQADIGISIFTPDRYMYLPIMGLFLVFVGLLHLLPQKFRLVLVLIFVLFWGAKTFDYLPVWKNSERLYNNALRVDPTCPEAIINRSKVFYDQGEAEKGITELDRFIDLYPSEFIGYMNRGKMLNQTKAYDKALADFNKALELRPKNFDGLLNRGVVYLSKEDYENARRDLSDAYDQDSTHFILNKSIARLYQQTKNFNVALKFANNCLAVQAADVEVLSVKGISLFYLERNEDALPVFNQIIELKPTLGDIYYYRSMTYYLLGEFVKSKNDLEKAQQLNATVEQKFVNMLSDALTPL